MPTEAALDLLQRRFDELLCLCSIFGPDQLTVEALDPPELFAALLQGELCCNSCAHLVEQHTQLTLLLHPYGVPPARLHLRLPSAYPGAAAPAIVAVTCDALRRQWEQQALHQLQAAADDASEECLYSLAEALLARLQQAGQAASAPLDGPQHKHQQPAPAQQAQQQAQAQGPGQQSQQQQQQQQTRGDAGQQLALLKLDHMHSRGSYSRLIRRWAAELGLAGRLLFCGSSPIILIMLRGPVYGLKEFLLRMRTRNVDMDSKGRPCRERMMTVLAIDSCGTCGSSTAAACGGDLALRGVDGSKQASVNPHTCQCGGQDQLFQTFEEEDVDVAQLAARLWAAGLLQHWAAATGLPLPS